MCLRCKRRALRDTAAQKLCGRCFTALIERRVRRSISKLEFPSKIVLLNDNSLEAAVTLRIARKLFRKEIIISDKKTKNAIVPWSADKEAAEILENMLLNKKRNNGIKILKNVLREELKLYAKINKLNYKVERNKNTGNTIELIKELEKLSPGVRFALANLNKHHGK
jgi:hypothetical protein